MPNFTEKQPGQRINETLHQFSLMGKLLEVKLLSLQPDNAARLIVQASAYLSESEKEHRARIERYGAPKFQKLDGEGFVFLDDEQKSYLLKFPSDKAQRSELKIPEMWAYLGKEAVYPVEATLKCVDNTVVLELLGPDQDYQWMIGVSGTLYTGSYTQGATK